MRSGASHHSSDCMAISLDGYFASNFEGSALGSAIHLFQRWEQENLPQRPIPSQHP